MSRWPDAVCSHARARGGGGDDDDDDDDDDDANHAREFARECSSTAASRARSYVCACVGDGGDEACGGGDVT